MRRTRKPTLTIPWWQWLIQCILLRYVRVDDAWLQTVRRAANRGPIFFVLRNRSLIDLLALRGLCRKHSLPEVSFVTGVSSFFYLPFVVWLWRVLFERGRNAVLRRLEDVFSTDGSAVVFLRRPAVGGALGSSSVAEDGVQLVVEAQASSGLRIQALPTVFLWGEAPMKRFPGTMDFLFGSNEYPRLLRSIWLLLRRRSVHELMVGEPLDLAAIRDERHIEGRALAGVIRAGVGRKIEIIRRSRLGSLTKPSSRIMREVLKSARLKRQLKSITENELLSEEELTSRVGAIIKKLATDFRPRVISLFAVVMLFIWKRIYTGVDVRKRDMERIRRAIANGASLLLPTHKSHIDYLVLSHVMKDHHLMLPHIAAGQNLSFWPLGWLFRSCGAFFIRRSFINDRFYTAVVSAYVRRLVQEGYAIEVFIEGGRSRTGKLLRPKTGMLDMSIKALTVSPRANLTVVPVFIGYEHVIEEQAYVAESKGQPKRAENIKGLLSTTKVLFSRYGRVYLRVGNPFSIDEMLTDRGLSRSDLLADSARRSFARDVGIKNLAEVDRISIATPSAVLSTVLLSNNHNQIEHDTLRTESLWLVEFLATIGASLSAMLTRWREESANSDDLIERSISVFIRTGRIASSLLGDKKVYTIREGQRLPLDYYKNNVIHFFVPSSLAANACLESGETGVEIAHLQKQVSLGCLLYRNEFISIQYAEQKAVNSCSGSELIVSRAIEQLISTGVIEKHGNKVTVKDASKALLLANILRNYHEVYLAAIEGARTKRLEDVDSSIGALVQSLTEAHLETRQFIKPEGHSALNHKSALNAVKELKLLRPVDGVQPFDSDGTGEELYQYLIASIRVGRT